MSFQTLSPDFRESLRAVADALAQKQKKLVNVRVAMDQFDNPIDTPKPISEAMPLPRREDVMDGVLWLGFAMEKGDYSEYKSWPNAIRYKGKTLAKKSWNSDSMNIYYEEREAIPTKDISGD